MRIILSETTCQICGRPTKAKSGVIAHHGYKRPNLGSGWQTASCPGARHLPYEISCDILPPTIEMIKSHISLQKNILKEHMKSPPEKLITVVRNYPYTTKEVFRPKGFDPRKMLIYIPYSYESEFNRIKEVIEKQIKYSEIDLKYMEERLKNWIPQYERKKIRLYCKDCRCELDIRGSVFTHYNHNVVEIEDERK